MNQGKKFVGKPKHPLDFGHQKRLAKKLDALLNGKITDAAGNEIGQIFYADGNTIFQIEAASALEVLKYDPAKAWAKGAALAKVRHDDDAVVTGVNIGTVDVPVIVKATPGKWIALQAVPMPPTLAAHIPQLPMPAGTDPENAGNFWEFVTPATICIGGEAIEV